MAEVQMRKSHPDVRRKRKHDNISTTLLDDIAWTATRCSRLLRSIESRIAILRRISRSANNILGPECTSTQTHGSRNESVTRTGGCRGDNDNSEDPLWLSQPDSRCQSDIKTYATGGKHPIPARHPTSKFRLKENNLNFSSPLLRHFRRKDLDISQDSANLKGLDQLPRFQPRKNVRTYAKYLSEADEAERQLEMAFLNVLIATREPNPARRPGARSLKSICSRQVCSYIDLDNEITNANGGDMNYDCASDIYMFLEDMGSNGNRGWRGLREVVRAHSMRLVNKAVEEQLLSHSAIEKLLDVCSSNSELDGGQNLLKSWLLSTGPLVSPGKLNVLEMFCKRHDSYEFLFRVWHGLSLRDSKFLRFLIQRPGFDDVILKGLMECTGLEASNLLRDCVVSSANPCGPHNAISDESGAQIKSTMTNAIARVTIVAAVCIIMPEVQTRQSYFSEHIYRAACSLCIASLRTSHSGAPVELQRFSMTALLLLTLQSERPNNFLAHNAMPLTELLVIHAEDSKDSKTDIDHDCQKAFAREFAEGILSLESYLHTDLVSRLITRLISLGDTVMASDGLLWNVRLELAIAASRSEYGKQDDPVLMEEISKLLALTTKTPSSTSPTTRPVSKTLRWEESICEWMLTTPLAVRPEYLDFADLSTPANNSNNEDCGNEISSHTESDHKSEVLPSSPDVLACSPCFQHVGLENISPLRMRAPIAKARSRRSLPEPRFDDSPDVLTMYDGEQKKYKNETISRKRLRFSLPERPALSQIHPNATAVAHSERQHTRSTAYTMDSDEDELV